MNINIYKHDIRFICIFEKINKLPKQYTSISNII